MQPNFIRRSWLSLALFASTLPLLAQSRPNRPRIVVGMVVDQMCWDYLYRYNDRFGEGGFRRLLSEGFNCHNARINYLPAVTAIGHASVYTGSVPSIHGISGNAFHINGKPTYCTQDNSVSSVGAEPNKAGQMSPRNMLATTITDELRLATNFRSKVVGVAIKDRGAILPAGHSANAAYWLDDASGNFITSTYYMSELPRWAKRFNDQKRTEKLLKEGWKPLYPISSYKESTADDNLFESPWRKDDKPTLPLDTKSLMKEFGLGVIRTTPMGNTLTLEMARAAIEGEALGKTKDQTDFLAISLSSTDYIGHRYGTFAIETEDTYLRLDRELADFFSYLDKTYGKDGYLFFITSDHAAGHNITFLKHNKLPGRSFYRKEAMERLRRVAKEFLQSDEEVVKGISNYQVVLDNEKLASMKVNRIDFIQALSAELERMDGVAYAVPAERIGPYTLPDELRMRVTNGFNRHRSGQIFIILHPGWAFNSSENPRGTDHSVWSPYDTHIPLIFMGHGIKAGHLYREVHMTDIAPTLSFLLQTQLPSGAIGKPILELMKD